ncbi:hypothetical protein B0T24DRAFT_80819 [Lasiosphaeria ovina]|uniref:Uncharacterized protein n=1 Tax=Lasiosphaeria ovina TaxID=92902 RepID=A0AAE0NML5_9PEZI|nr:hypothetical protein B0T24DRAFT_80819 [Lasiosphaeria ovina]
MGILQSKQVKSGPERDCDVFYRLHTHCLILDSFLFLARWPALHLGPHLGFSPLQDSPCLVTPDEPMAKDKVVLALLAHVLSGALGAPAGRGMSELCADRDDFHHILVVGSLRRHGRACSSCLLVDTWPESTGYPRRSRVRSSYQALGNGAGRGDSVHRRRAGQLVQGHGPRNRSRRVRGPAAPPWQPGDVLCMDALVMLVSKTTDPRILLLPAVHPVPGEGPAGGHEHGTAGISDSYRVRQRQWCTPGLSHGEKLAFVRRMACAFQAYWSIVLLEPHPMVRAYSVPKPTRRCWCQRQRQRGYGYSSRHRTGPPPRTGWAARSPLYVNFSMHTSSRRSSPSKKQPDIQRQ